MLEQSERGLLDRRLGLLERSFPQTQRSLAKRASHTVLAPIVLAAAGIADGPWPDWAGPSIW